MRLDRIFLVCPEWEKTATRRAIAPFPLYTRGGKPPRGTASVRIRRAGHALASRDRAEFRVSPVYSLRPKSWRAHALREMVHRQRHPIMLLLDHRIQRLEHRADNDFRDRLHFPVTMESRSYYISRFGAAPADFSGIWAIIQSIVSINPAIEAAFCRAVRVTLQGSRIPNSTMSPY